MATARTSDVRCNTIRRVRNTLTRLFAENKSIAKILSPADQMLFGDELLETHIYPYDFLPDTSEDAFAYLCFDVDITSSTDSLTKNLKIYIWVFCHQSIIKTENGMRIDLLAEEIEKTLNGNIKLGLGSTELDFSRRLVPAPGYVGRVMGFNFKDFNRPKKFGYTGE